MTLLLDSKYLTYLIALLAAVISGSSKKVYDVLNNIYAANTPTLIGALLSLLGFVIAALALVISLQDRRLVAVIIDESDLWSQLLSVFSNTAKLLSIFAFSLFVSSQTQINDLDLFYQCLYCVIFTFFLTLTILQVAKIIHILERIGSMAGSVRRK